MKRTNGEKRLRFFESNLSMEIASCICNRAENAHKLIVSDQLSFNFCTVEKLPLRRYLHTFQVTKPAAANNALLIDAPDACAFHSCTFFSVRSARITLREIDKRALQSRCRYEAAHRSSGENRWKFGWESLENSCWYWNNPLLRTMNFELKSWTANHCAYHLESGTWKFSKVNDEISWLWNMKYRSGRRKRGEKRSGKITEGWNFENLLEPREPLEVLSSRNVIRKFGSRMNIAGIFMSCH